MQLQTSPIILFLDFDGPLFPERSNFLPGNHSGEPCIHPELPRKMHYWNMDPIAVHFLNQIHKEHKFLTVVSSTWRELCSREEIELLFRVNDLRLQFADDWATQEIGTRLDDIAEYIKRNNVKAYFIIDDPWSGPDLMDASMSEHCDVVSEDAVFLCNPEEGIDYHLMKKIDSYLLRMQ